MTRGRGYKVMLLLLAAALLAGTSVVQNSLNRARDQLGLTRVQPLENAPPMLAFTTVALGGFRGLISNALWIRANDLQDEDKFFEMAQLADWITKLEPHFVQVWLVQAWNMAYNISVKFTDYSDRWRWVKRGFELLRDDGLRYNPNETLIYRELGWIFEHKLGQNLDDGNMYYKEQWAREMEKVFGNKQPDLDELINPQTEDQKQRAHLLRDTYKMDPVFMKAVDERYGPLEWRLPEAHAIYWGALGLKAAENSPTKVNSDDLITLRRLIYQSMLLSFQRGRLITNALSKGFEFGPNLDIIPKVSEAYLQASRDDAKNHDHILRAHRNFLRDAIYFLYSYNRVPEAAYWFKYVCTNYPNQMLLDGTAYSYPTNMTLDSYAVGRVQEDVGEGMDQKRIQAIIEGMIANGYIEMAKGHDELAAGYALKAQKVREYYEKNTSMRRDALPIGSMEDIRHDVLGRLLDTEHGLPFPMRAVLRTKLELGPEAAAPPSTNSPPAINAPAPTNAPAATL